MDGFGAIVSTIVDAVTLGIPDEKQPLKWVHIVFGMLFVLSSVLLLVFLYYTYIM